jgi:hypothetical protein
MTGRKSRSGRRPRIPGQPAGTSRLEAVRRALPKDEQEIGGTELIGKLQKEAGSRASAIRWLKEAQRRRVVRCRVDGRRRWYSIAFLGFMEAGQAEEFLRGAPIGFLRGGPKISGEYKDSLEGMTLFWQQASSALVLSLERVITAAQSISFAQIEGRPMPSVNVARQQADVLTEVFVKPWVSDLVASLHLFLENERRKNVRMPRLANTGPPGRPGRLAAPSSMEALRKGWEWASGPQGAAHLTWVHRMKGEESGPWGAFLERMQSEQEAEMKRIVEQAAGAPEPSRPPALAHPTAREPARARARARPRSAAPAP